MTREQIAEIVDTWVPRLGLEHWEITVHWEPHPLDADDPPSFDTHDKAWVHRARDYDEARMYFNEKAMEYWTARDAHATVVHELLHLVTRDVEFVLDMLDEMLHRDVDTLVMRAHRHAVEGAIDRLAYRIVDMMGVTDG